MALKFRVVAVPTTRQETKADGSVVTKSLADDGVYQVDVVIWDDATPDITLPFSWSSNVPPASTAPNITTIRQQALDAIYARARAWNAARLIQADLASFVGPTVRNVP